MAVFRGAIQLNEVTVTEPRPDPWHGGGGSYLNCEDLNYNGICDKDETMDCYDYDWDGICDEEEYGGGGGSDSDKDVDVDDDTWENGDIIVENPENPITDIEDYLECFDTTLPATLTVYVNEPNPGSGDTHNGTFVGHTFISIKQGKNISTFGFYPVSDNIYPYINNSSSSVLGDDGSGKEPYSSSISSEVSGSQLKQILSKVKNHNTTYHLDNYNCTDFAIDIGSLGGLNLPPSNDVWPGGSGSNPGTLGQHIRSLSTDKINTSGGNAPSTKKEC